MDAVIVQYVGFQAKSLVREYTFTVREAPSDPLQYILEIANEAFESHRARYQDAPDICSLKLRRELVAHANHPPETRFVIADGELADYRDARKVKPAGLYYKRPEEQE
jgi:hypothetical protein